MQSIHWGNLLHLKKGEKIKKEWTCEEEHPVLKKPQDIP